MNVFITYYPHNRPGKKDGDYFKTHAEKAAKFYNTLGYAVTMFALPKANDATKRAAFLNKLAKYPVNHFGRLLLFCHGTEKWCDAGLTVDTVTSWAQPLRNALASRACLPRVALYCCLTAKTQSTGLAAMISQTTQAHVVLGHTTSGDAVFNPYKAAYFMGGANHAKLHPAKGIAKFHTWLTEDSNAMVLFETAQDPVTMLFNTTGQERAERAAAYGAAITPTIAETVLVRAVSGDCLDLARFMLNTYVFGANLLQRMYDHARTLGNREMQNLF